MLREYEIHYLLQGHKKVSLHASTQMTEFDAWFCAALDCAIPLRELPSLRSLAIIKSILEPHGISSVRWNLAPKTSVPQK
ncbi:DUF6555 family protein [Pseudomonas sp. CF161]|uniref:DUF6555 family protein n=1 Tax=Pseudomonas sp. CF161 TaxID=911241 RepID=UPI000355120A|nr:DUF6555 family protein [Pseudomonas sp. CF161]EPL16157.1 hypothetical protein CF161_01560 [Pseudomonas sp. CF161]